MTFLCSLAGVRRPVSRQIPTLVHGSQSATPSDHPADLPRDESSRVGRHSGSIGAAAPGPRPILAKLDLRLAAVSHPEVGRRFSWGYT